MSESEQIVIPCSPNDEEKLIYLNSDRSFYYTFGCFSFLSLNIGFFFFIKSSVYLFPFGIVTLYLFIYFCFSYFIGLIGKDFDYKFHKRLIFNWNENNNLPLVDIFLPCCGEPLVVLRNTYEHVKQIRYSNLKVYVLDDKNMVEVKELAKEFGFNYIVRSDRPYMKKAGNLRNAFKITNGEFFLILDADFCPRYDIFTETLPYFYYYKNLAILQTPQFFRVRENQTWVEKAAGSVQELFYRLIQVSRDRFNASICVGTSAIYRRQALIPFGGTYEIEHSEDLHTGFNVTNQGWLVKYLPINLSMGMCPDELSTFFTQQYRWASGSTSLCMNKIFWKSNLTLIQKICYLSGMFYYSATAISIFLVPLISIVVIYFFPSNVNIYHVIYQFPSFIFSFIIMRTWSNQKYRSYVLKIRIFTYYAHLIALFDIMFDSRMEWKVTGTKNKTNNKLTLAIIILITWTSIYSSLIIFGIIWKSFEFKIYHFLPSLFFCVFNLWLTIEIFCGEDYRRNYYKNLLILLKRFKNKEKKIFKYNV